MKTRNSDMKWTSHRTPHPEPRANHEYYLCRCPACTRRDCAACRSPAVRRAVTPRYPVRTAALTCQQQAVFFLRWLLDGTRTSQLVTDNNISTSTGYDRLH